MIFKLVRGWDLLDEYFFIEKIQSDKSCDFILNEVTNFNKTILDEIDKCNLNEVKKSAENYLLQQENNTSHLFDRYFSEIISRKYLFNRKKMIYEHLSKITKESLKKFAIDGLLENKNKCIFKLCGN